MTTANRIEESRVIAADPATIFDVLRDPRGHVNIDSSGMLMDASGTPASAVDDEFVVHMDREALGDRPMGRYDVTVHITAYEAPRTIEWSIQGVMDPPVGHVYGYRLEPVEDGTRVTSYCDWTNLHPQYRDRIEFPIVPASALKATLGILARTVQRHPR